MPTLPILESALSGRRIAGILNTFSPRPLADPSSPIEARNPSNDFSSFIPTDHDAAYDLAARDTYFALPASYDGLDGGPSAGTVAGITLGCVFGFLLVIWLAQTLINSPNREQRYIEGDASEVYVTRRAGDHSRRKRRKSRSESTSGTAAPPERRERIVVQETRRTESRRPPQMAERQPEVIDVNIRTERRVDGDDVIEVVEEHGPDSDLSAARRQRRRESRGAYRSVDPAMYAGGNHPPQEYRSSRRPR